MKCRQNEPAVYFSQKIAPECRLVVFLLADNCLVESTVITHWGEIHICLSTMAGCPVGCRHCATTYSPKPYTRNLALEELSAMGQMLLGTAAQITGHKGRLPVILSFSGHGEPLINWDAVNRCAHQLLPMVDKIYLTTIGITPVLEKILASGNRDIDLFISLHGASDRERQRLIPPGPGRPGVERLFSFGNAFRKTGGRVVFNYMLTRHNSTGSALDRLGTFMNRFERPAELRLTGYTDIGYDTGVRASPGTWADANALAKQMQTACPGWQVRYSVLTGAEAGVACGQMRAEQLETYPRLEVRI